MGPRGGGSATLEKAEVKGYRPQVAPREDRRQQGEQQTEAIGPEEPHRGIGDNREGRSQMLKGSRGPIPIGGRIGSETI